MKARDDAAPNHSMHRSEASGRSVGELGLRRAEGGGVREIHATAVEVYTEFDVLIVHFDDGGDHYLQLRAPEDEESEEEAGFGNVDVEVDDQAFSGHNCFSLAELGRSRFRLVLARDEAMTRIGEVVVTFSLDDGAFDLLRRGLERAFRAFPGFRIAGA